MIEDWVLRLRGGAWDGAEVTVAQSLFPSPEDGPPACLYMYKCDGKVCTGHMQFDLSQCPLHTVVVYNREAASRETRIARYVLGDLIPEQEHDRELALAGVSGGWDPDLERESLGRRNLSAD